MNELALFAGAGGGILGGHLLGWHTVCAVEWEPYPASVLAARQNDGLLPAFPIWDDVRTFDGRPWRGLVDVVSGGFPCQDISVAGKGAGIDGARSGMWAHMARIVGEVRPRFVFVENSPALLTRGLGRVLSDLATLGYDCRWTVLGAADVGAPHKRDRFWLVATDANRFLSRNERQKEMPENRRMDQWKTIAEHDGLAGDVADAASKRQPQPWERGHASDCTAHSGWKAGHVDHDGEWWATEPDVGRVADGVAARVDRLKAIGNGQVPLCAATAWRLLTTQPNQGT
jgi:DNA (cytosine-5)-methyltransferase 1